MTVTMLRALKHRIVPDTLWRAPILSGPLRGVAIHFNPAIEVRKVLGLYERPLQRVLRDLLFGSKMDCFDLGAGSGYYTSVFGALSRGRVLAIDIAPVSASIILRSHAGDPRIVAKSARLGAPEEPDTITIDQLVERNFLPNLVKMDIEGHEATAMLGARATLAERRTSWIIETHGQDVEDRCIAILKAAGCHVRIIADDGGERAYRALAHNRWLLAVPGHA